MIESASAATRDQNAGDVVADLTCLLDGQLGFHGGHSDACVWAVDVSWAPENHAETCADLQQLHGDLMVVYQRWRWRLATASLAQ